MIKLLRQRTFVYGAALAAGILGLGVGQSVLQKRAEAQGSTVQAPVFEVDPLWPKPRGRAAQQRAWRRAQSADRGMLSHRPAHPGL